VTIIDRYVTRTFLGSYLILLLVGIGLYVFSDVLVNLDEFTEGRDLSVGQVLLKIADYHGNNLPLYYSQLGGVLLAISVVAAGTVPVSMPWMARRIINWYTFWANPIRQMITAPPNMARTTMILRP